MITEVNEGKVSVWDDALHMKHVWDAIQDKPIYLNQSRVQLFHNCHRKFYWWAVLGLEPDRPRWPLAVGTATHLGLALLGSGKTVDEAVAESRKNLMDSLPKRRLPGDEEDAAEHANVVEKLLRGYAAEYEGKTTWIPIAQETKGVVEVGEGTHVYVVFRTDKLATWNGRLWIVDHKTAGKLDLRDLMKYEMALQFSAYSYAITKFLHQRVAGIIIDVLVKTKLPQYTRDLKTRSDAELVEFEKEFVETGKEIAWRLSRVEAGEEPKTVFYKNTDECFRYGTCPYRELCMQDNPTRRSLYTQRQEDYVDVPTNAALLEKLEMGR